MVSTHFHFNGFFPNMLYFFILSYFFFVGYTCLPPTFIIKPFFNALHQGVSLFIFIHKKHLSDMQKNNRFRLLLRFK